MENSAWYKKINFQLVVAIFVMIVGFLLLYGPLAYSFKNPELTSMQLFQMFWWRYLLGGITIAFGSSLLGK